MMMSNFADSSPILEFSIGLKSTSTNSFDLASRMP